jgi:hypothetical protein
MFRLQDRRNVTDWSINEAAYVMRARHAGLPHSESAFGTATSSELGSAGLR